VDWRPYAVAAGQITKQQPLSKPQPAPVTEDPLLRRYLDKASGYREDYLSIAWRTA